MPRKVVTRVLEKNVLFSSFTSTSPKVSVTANKRVPRKKIRRGSEGFQI